MSDAKRTLEIWRGGPDGGERVPYELQAEPGMVVLDAVLAIQHEQAQDLAVRWNCKAAKCGSCSAEINGRPRLMCKTRLDHLPADRPITVEPMKSFPVIRDLVTDVSWNYEVNQRIPPFTPRSGCRLARSDRRTSTGSRNSASASSASCARTCATSSASINPMTGTSARGSWCGSRASRCIRWTTLDRLDLVADEGGLGLCNITKCCTEVCPEEIHITDNAIIPLKERVADRRYDPLIKTFRKLLRRAAS